MEALSIATKFPDLFEGVPHVLKNNFRPFPKKKSPKMLNFDIFKIKKISSPIFFEKKNFAELFF